MCHDPSAHLQRVSANTENSTDFGSHIRTLSRSLFVAALAKVVLAAIVM